MNLALIAIHNPDRTVSERHVLFIGCDAGILARHWFERERVRRNPTSPVEFVATYTTGEIAVGSVRLCDDIERSCERLFSIVNAPTTNPDALSC